MREIQSVHAAGIHREEGDAICVDSHPAARWLFLSRPRLSSSGAPSWHPCAPRPLPLRLQPDRESERGLAGVGGQGAGESRLSVESRCTDFSSTPRPQSTQSSMASREYAIFKTEYVADIDHQVAIYIPVENIASRKSRAITAGVNDCSHKRCDI